MNQTHFIIKFTAWCIYTYTRLKLTLKAWVRLICSNINPSHLHPLRTGKNSLRNALHFLFSHKTYDFVHLDQITTEQRLGANISLLTSYPMGRQPIRAYKNFRVFGKNVDLALRGGPAFSRCAWNCIQIRQGFLLGDTNGLYTEKQFFTPFRYHKDVSLLGHFNRDGLLESQHNICIKKMYPKREKINKIIYFDSNLSYSSNYFHFMIDCLPALLLSLNSLKRNRPDRAEFTLVAPAHLHPNIRAIIQDVATFFGINIKFFGPFTRIQFNEAIMASFPTSMHNFFPKNENFSVNPLAIRYTRLILRRVYSAVTATKHSRFYVSRASATNLTSKRHVTNHLAIAKYLHKFGFETRNASELSLHEQIALMKSAKTMIFDGGAALASLLFAQRCDQIILLAMTQGTDCSLFVSFCQALNCKITYACGPIDDKDPNAESWQKSYSVPISILTQALESMDVR